MIAARAAGRTVATSSRCLTIEGATVRLAFPAAVAEDVDSLLEGLLPSWTSHEDARPHLELRLWPKESVPRGVAQSSDVRVAALSSGRWDFARVDDAFMLAYDRLDAVPLRRFLAIAFVHLLAPGGFQCLHGASCLSPANDVLLLCGASGSGKTTLAFELARRGFTRLSENYSLFSPGAVWVPFLDHRSASSAERGRVALRRIVCLQPGNKPLSLCRVGPDVVMRYSLTLTYSHVFGGSDRALVSQLVGGMRPEAHSALHYRRDVDRPADCADLLAEAFSRAES